ncbi:hypothetical protein A9Q89_03095 [Gammaproteobacteria bacterium 53_120_T64]|nr:hypothetical protein A9Q89_03095 [Gammaproteobacteria bacterium 53_120_T64]
MQAGELSAINNYLQYSSYFASSGQPSAEQLEDVANAGFKRVIYLAFSNSKTAIEIEDHVVKSLGMDYLHIPVDLERPTRRDFDNFSAVMKNNKKQKTLLHCQINKRASSFSFLYRVIYAGVPMGEAKRDLDSIWQPNKIWYQFMVEVLKQHGHSHLCDGCDWGANELN